jgi:hypothetical protein
MSRTVPIATSLLSAVALLVVVAVSDAVAETGSQWLVLTSGGVTKTTKELPVGVTGEMGGGKEILLTKIAGVKFEKPAVSLKPSD